MTSGAGDQAVVPGDGRVDRDGPLAGLIDTDWWTDAAVEATGVAVYDVPLVTVGGGLGSFALVDYLRIAGVPVESMRVVTPLELPHETYEYLCANSQIPRHERLRSDSQSTMDNIWGFPSYAWREAWADKSPKVLWNVLTEPLLTNYFTPKAGQVFASVEKEAGRIAWDAMRYPGVARQVRRRDGGGYFVTVRGRDDGVWAVMRTRFVHLSPGYGALRFLPDLQAYRTRFRDQVKVVNAYEPHDHVYERLKARPGTVLVRGSGIVGSRVLQRLIDDRDQLGSRTTILHLFLPGTYVAEPQGTTATFTRPGHSGFAYQGFNFPKSAWGGQYRDHLETLEGQARVDFLNSIGGTNTPVRKSWQEQLSRGMAEGFYNQRIGQVQEIQPVDGGGDALRVDVRGDDGTVVPLEVDFVIDATGLIAGPRDHDLLADVLDHSGAQLNPAGRLDVERSSELRGTRNDTGRIYASGSSTFGGYFAAADSFLGLQYTAQRITEDLAAAGFCKPIGPLRSVGQWWRWARGISP